MLEEFSYLTASIFQTGIGTTSYTENIVSIGFTRVASRRVIVMGACVMLALLFLASSAQFWLRFRGRWLAPCLWVCLV